jgi:hypothetical protein
MISFQSPQCLKGFAAYGMMFMLQNAFGIGGTGSGCVFDGM